MRVACCIACSESKWINAVWRRENTNGKNSRVEETMKTMEDIGVEIQFEEGNNRIDRELVSGRWKLAWKGLKEKLKKGVKNQWIEEYRTKEQESKLYRRQERECHVWLSQNLNPGKTAAIMTILEHMVETRS